MRDNRIPDPLVSIVIPTYNRDLIVGRAIESALQQTYDSKEIIVVDDGSTDCTPEILARFGNRIRVIRTENLGPSAARNTGARAAKGRLVSFLDSDDTWLPRKIESQVHLLGQCGGRVSCCICNARYVDAPKNAETSLQIAGVKPDQEVGIWENPCRILATRFVLFNQVVAVYRSAFESVGGFNEKLWLLEDYDLALRLALRGPWAIITEPLVLKYEGLGDSLTALAVKQPIRVLTAKEKILMGLLNQTRSMSRSVRVLFEDALRSVRAEIRMTNLALTHSPGTAALGRSRILARRIYMALRRRSPWWPKAVVSAVG
jgi:glycosyltransferase involved in cell wall biosynthesis